MGAGIAEAMREGEKTPEILVPKVSGKKGALKSLNAKGGGKGIQTHGAQDLGVFEKPLTK